MKNQGMKIVKSFNTIIEWQGRRMNRAKNEESDREKE
jgi:hypothetical protein